MKGTVLCGPRDIRFEAGVKRFVRAALSLSVLSLGVPARPGAKGK